MSAPRPDWRDGVPYCSLECPNLRQSPNASAIFCVHDGELAGVSTHLACEPQVRAMTRVLLPLADVAAAEGEREVRAAREVALEIRDHGAGGER